MPNQIVIVIADDDVVLSQSLAALLQSQPDFEVRGVAPNGDEALHLVQEQAPSSMGCLSERERQISYMVARV